MNVDDLRNFAMTLAQSPEAPCMAVALYNNERANGFNLVCHCIHTVF